jgi:excisionase family DNA binding protein
VRKRQNVITNVFDPSHLQLLAIPDVAKLLSVGRSTVYVLINAREIETVKVANTRRVLVVSVHQYIERQRKAS